jgi:hypothetical protein
MRTVIFKPVILVLFFLATSIASLNATSYADGIKGAIKIELHPGFTIEDIIQDLYNNANITNVNVIHNGGNTYTLKFNPKMTDVSSLKQFLDGHPGCNIFYGEAK